MHKRYLELDNHPNSEPVIYTAVVTDCVKSIYGGKVLVKRVSDSDVFIQCNWNSGLKKGIKVSISDLHTLSQLYKIIINEEPSWKSQDRLFEAKEVDDI